MAGNSITAEQVFSSKNVGTTVSLSDSGILANRGLRGEDYYSWSEILGIEIEGPDALQKRITATRLLMTGPFALAFKKKTGEAFAFISFKDNRAPVVFRFPKKSEPEIKAFFARYKSRITPADVPTATSIETDSVDKLTKLAELFEKGLIDDVEFKASKAKILGLD